MKELIFKLTALENLKLGKDKYYENQQKVETMLAFYTFAGKQCLKKNQFWSKR